MNSYLIDTDILIDISKGNEKAADFVDNIKGDTSVSIINLMELIVGARNKNEIREIEEFLQNYRIVNLNDIIVNTGYDLFKIHALTHGLTIPDSLIAATLKSKD